MALWQRWRIYSKGNVPLPRCVQYATAMRSLLRTSYYNAYGWRLSGMVGCSIIRWTNMRLLLERLGFIPLRRGSLGLRRIKGLCFLMWHLLVGIFGKRGATFCSTNKHPILPRFSFLSQIILLFSLKLLGSSSIDECITHGCSCGTFVSPFFSLSESECRC